MRTAPTREVTNLRVMMHFDQGGNNPDSTTFFTNLIARGVQFDVIGLSYYTFFHGPVASLHDNVDRLATQFDKDIVIAEAQSAWDTTATSSGRRARSRPATRPLRAASSPSTTTSCRSSPTPRTGTGAGLFYWSAPESVPGVGWEPESGTTT